MTPQTTTQAFFDPATGTVTYVVWDPATRRAAVIDPVLDYDFKSGRTGTASLDRVLAYVREQHLALDWILETHAHADHLSGAQYLKQHAGGALPSGSAFARCRRLSASSTTSSPASCPTAVTSTICSRTARAS